MLKFLKLWNENSFILPAYCNVTGQFLPVVSVKVGSNLDLNNILKLCFLLIFSKLQQSVQQKRIDTILGERSAFRKNVVIIPDDKENASMSNKTPKNHVTHAPATPDDKENASTPAYKPTTKHFTHTPAAPKTQTLPHVTRQTTAQANTPSHHMHIHQCIPHHQQTTRQVHPLVDYINMHQHPIFHHYQIATYTQASLHHAHIHHPTCKTH